MRRFFPLAAVLLVAACCLADDIEVPVAKPEASAAPYIRLVANAPVHILFTNESADPLVYVPAREGMRDGWFRLFDKDDEEIRPTTILCFGPERKPKTLAPGESVTCTFHASQFSRKINPGRYELWYDYRTGTDDVTRCDVSRRVAWLDIGLEGGDREGEEFPDPIVPVPELGTFEE